MQLGASDASNGLSLPDLPDALLGQVVRSLGPRDLGRLRLTCHTLRDSIDHSIHPKFGVWGKLAILRQQDVGQLQPMLNTELGKGMLRQLRQMTLRVGSMTSMEQFQQVWRHLLLHGHRLQTIRCILPVDCRRSTLALAHSMLGSPGPLKRQVVMEVQLASPQYLYPFLKIIHGKHILFHCHQIHAGPSLQWLKKHLYTPADHRALHRVVPRCSKEGSASQTKVSQALHTFAIRASVPMAFDVPWHRLDFPNMQAMLLDRVSTRWLKSFSPVLEQCAGSLLHLCLVQGAARAWLDGLAQRAYLLSPGPHHEQDRRSLPRLEALQSLHLQYNYLSGKNVIRLLDALGSRNLRHLNLAENYLSDEELPALRRHPSFAQLETLVLQKNVWNEASLLDWLAYARDSRLQHLWISKPNALSHHDVCKWISHFKRPSDQSPLQVHLMT